MRQVQLQTADLRRSSRYPLSRMVAADHPTLGDLTIQVANISSGGFMTSARAGILRGDRLALSLAHIGQVEAVCLWTRHQQAGFLFERKVSATKLMKLIAGDNAGEGSLPMTDTALSNDARKEIRKRMLAVARLYTGTGWHNVRVKDISAIGARIAFVSEQATKGDLLFVRGDDIIAARIVWLNGNEAGLQFYREIRVRPDQA